MTTPTSRAAYKAEYDLLDKALESTTGVRIEFESQGDARHLQVRLHKARSYDRDLNRESRSPDDPLYGVSDFDCLTVRIREDEGKWWVYIERYATGFRVEEIKTRATSIPTHKPRRPTLTPNLKVRPI